jgi:hypothetical protein
MVKKQAKGAPQYFDVFALFFYVFFKIRQPIKI